MPSTPAQTPSLPSGSRSGRSGYPGAPDTYYESRYPSGPPGYDPGAPPPRSDWRSWDDRSRGRPALYPSVSPRGRRYDDDRHDDYYVRDDDRYPDRVLPAYDPDYRSMDYARREHRDYPSHPVPRGYPDDYHRGMKVRDRREAVYHARGVPSPARVLRRSRSPSPRSIASSGGRSRARDFEPKSDVRYRDVSTPRCRSPVLSPARSSGAESYVSRKYRSEARYASPSPHAYARRGEDRRLESRDKQEGGGEARSSSSSSVRSKVVQDAATAAATSWGDGGAWNTAGNADYDRSRSETPTRDENLGSIGEVIIKQQPASSAKSKRDSERRKSLDSSPVKGNGESVRQRASSSDSAARSDREADGGSQKSSSSKLTSQVSRVRSSSPSSSSDRKREDHRLKKRKDRAKGNVAKSPAASTSSADADERATRAEHRDGKSKDRSRPLRRSRSRESARVTDRSKLIKREYSPSSQGDSNGRSGKPLLVRRRSRSGSADESDRKNLKRRSSSAWNATEDPPSDQARSDSKKRRRSESGRGKSASNGGSSALCQNLVVFEKRQLNIFLSKIRSFKKNVYFFMTIFSTPNSYQQIVPVENCEHTMLKIHAHIHIERTSSIKTF